CQHVDHGVYGAHPAKIKFITPENLIYRHCDIGQECFRGINSRFPVMAGIELVSNIAEPVCLTLRQIEAELTSYLYEISFVGNSDHGRDKYDEHDNREAGTESSPV